MIGQTHGGKGSTSRAVDKNKFDENFDRIFGKKSPCVKECQLNKDTQRCSGCDRTLDEIAECGRAKKTPT